MCVDDDLLLRKSNNNWGFLNDFLFVSFALIRMNIELWRIWGKRRNKNSTKMMEKNEMSLSDQLNEYFFRISRSPSISECFDFHIPFQMVFD